MLDDDRNKLLTALDLLNVATRLHVIGRGEPDADRRRPLLQCAQRLVEYALAFLDSVLVSTRVSERPTQSRGAVAVRASAGWTPSAVTRQVLAGVELLFVAARAVADPVLADQLRDVVQLAMGVLRLLEADGGAGATRIVGHAAAIIESAPPPRSGHNVTAGLWAPTMSVVDQIVEAAQSLVVAAQAAEDEALRAQLLDAAEAAAVVVSGLLGAMRAYARKSTARVPMAPMPARSVPTSLSRRLRARAQRVRMVSSGAGHHPSGKSRSGANTSA